jgi:pectate lyase
MKCGRAVMNGVVLGMERAENQALKQSKGSETWRPESKTNTRHSTGRSEEITVNVQTADERYALAKADVEITNCGQATSCSMSATLTITATLGRLRAKHSLCALPASCVARLAQLSLEARARWAGYRFGRTVGRLSNPCMI